MAQQKTMRIGALNIKTQPHSTQNYKDLFSHAHSYSCFGKIYGSDWGIIGSLRPMEVNEIGDILFGTIYRFLNIDPDAPWLDLKNMTSIDPEKNDGFSPIPAHLKPNSKEIFYIFIPERHRLFFETRHITPGSMRKFVSALFATTELVENYGEVDVCVESTRDIIEQIIQIPRLTRLEIKYTRPNDDDLSGLEQRVIDRLDGQGIRTFHQVATTTDQGGINPDNETQALMKVACSNGRINAYGRDTQDEKVELSTKDHPLMQQVRYDPDLEQKLDVMLHATASMLMKM